MAKNNWGKSRLPNPRLYELRFTANHHGDKAYRYLNFSELSGEKLHTIKLSFSTHAATKTYIKLQVINPGEYYFDKVKFSSNRTEDDYFF